MAEQEVMMPVADPNDPYALPAAMPSSVDNEPRSFEVDDFAIPTRQQEDWRYTPVERIEEFFHVFTPSGKTKVSVTNIDGTPVDDTKVRVSTVDRDQAPSGTVMKPNDRVSAVEWNVGKTTVVVSVSGELAQPVLVNVECHDDALDSLHLVLQAADRTHGDIVVRHHGVARLAEGVEIVTGADSHVSTTFVQEWDQGSKHVGNHRIHVGSGASLRHAVVTLGGDVVRIRMDQDFGGPQSDLNMLGVYFAESGQHIEHRTMVVHNYADCKSRVVYKGALDGTDTHSTWVGNALIKPTAPNTDSYELNRNLVLTPGPIADSEPNLEIENGNIVGAGHATSVGHFDDEELFYLQSRGVSESEARKLVVRGFFADLIDQIGVPSMDEHLMNVIERRLARGESADIQAVLEDK
jgi:Fe-S cluster assembly protein SufD